MIRILLPFTESRTAVRNAGQTTGHLESEFLKANTLIKEIIGFLKFLFERSTLKDYIHASSI